MDISVFLLSQDHTVDEAPHRGTRTVIKLALAQGLVRPIGQNAVQLTTDAPWKEVKFAARAQTRVIHCKSFRQAYEHHIEPKLVSLMDISNPFERYLQGYSL